MPWPTPATDDEERGRDGETKIRPISFWLKIAKHATLWTHLVRNLQKNPALVHTNNLCFISWCFDPTTLSCDHSRKPPNKPNRNQIGPLTPSIYCLHITPYLSSLPLLIPFLWQHLPVTSFFSFLFFFFLPFGFLFLATPPSFNFSFFLWLWCNNATVIHLFSYSHLPIWFCHHNNQHPPK